jgi:glutamine phosphoribosylpyrophosphate amidotransferase
MCGIVGCWLANTDSSVGQMIYDALIMLQHRGQGA